MWYMVHRRICVPEDVIETAGCPGLPDRMDARSLPSGLRGTQGTFVQSLFCKFKQKDAIRY